MSKTHVRHRWAVAILGLAVLVLGAGVPFVLVSRDAVRRFYVYGVYANALTYYHDRYDSAPTTREALESAYRANEYRRGDTPPLPPHEPPVFRPAAGLPDGEYLVIVEPEPDGWFSWTRLVIYGRPDGSVTRLATAWRWTVEDRIRADDEARAQANAKLAEG